MSGKKITEKDLEELIAYAKGELEHYDKSTDEATVSLDDTNLPVLWSVEGLARLYRGVFGKQKGIQKLALKKSDYEVKVDKDIMPIRPHAAFFVAKGKKIDEYFLKQLIQLQEKLADNYGRKRKVLSIGLYSYSNIKFPVHYKAITPTGIKFKPLDFDHEATLKEILETHPKGKDYGYVLEGLSKYPCFVDDNNKVLSFVPVINSEVTGRLKEGDSEFLFEVTGTSEESVNLACSVFAYALADRGFDLYSVNINYPDKKIVSPRSFGERLKVDLKEVNSLLGLKLKESEFKALLEKAGFELEGNEVLIPDYRKDIMHPVDIVEEVALMYGYHNLAHVALSSYTIGSILPSSRNANRYRDFFVGAGYLEIMSAMLTNKELLYDKMNTKDFGTIEIEEYMSENFSVVRSWLLPILMDVLSKNKHADYPQKIFEQGICTIRNENKALDYNCVSSVTCHAKANYTEVKQLLDFISSKTKQKYTVKKATHPAFIEGRFAQIYLGKKLVGFMGEISPKILSNFSLELPAAALELNLSELF